VKKLFSFFLFLVVIAFAIALLNCGSDSHTTPGITSQFAFVQPSAGSGPTIMSPAERHLSAEHRQGFRNNSRLYSGRGLKPWANTIEPGTDSIVLMNNDGTGQLIIANQAGRFEAVQLGYDGKRGVVSAEDSNGYLQIVYVDLGDKNNPVVTELTTDAENHWGPQISWDGSKVVFTKWVDSANNYQAVIMSASGGTETVIPTDFEANYPTFTPDGKLVFENDDTDTISIMNTDGTGLATITSEQDTEHGDWAPSVSPDGKTVVLSRQSNIYSVAITGGTVTQLTKNGRSWDPMFVKDKIVYISYPTDGSSAEVLSMNVDGTNPKRLTTDTVDEYFEWD
jgi:Tol biopolymer transport system component